MYREKNSEWIKHLDFELIDIICLEIAFYAVYFMRHYGVNIEMNQMYIRSGIVLVAFDLMVLFFQNSYKGIIQRNKWQELASVVRHVSVTEVLLILFEYVTKETDDLSRTVFLGSWALSIILCFFTRCAWKKVVRRKVMLEKNQETMLLISSADRYQMIIEKLEKKDYREFRINCVALFEGREENDTEYQFLHSKEETLDYIRQNVVDEVFIDWDNNEEVNELSDIFLSMGVTVHIGLEYLPEALPNCNITKIGEANTVTTSIKTASGWKLTLKRLIDIAGAIVGLFITGIACIFVVPAIKIASPGPAFFKQQRVGKNGRTFYLYKFRSMYMDAEERKKELMAKNEMNGLMFKMENDPRIIGSEKGPGKGLGNFIRKTSIDELPQFWNILKGDMSLIGTRPPTFNEYEEYDLHHKIRLSMKPGLTGMWQVSGRSDITDFEEVVKLDTEYIENWSIGLDITILFKTFGVVFKGKGSK